MLITDEDREWIDSRADELFRESERSRGGVRPATTLPQDYRDYFVVQAAWERFDARLITASPDHADHLRAALDREDKERERADCLQIEAETATEAAGTWEELAKQAEAERDAARALIRDVTDRLHEIAAGDMSAYELIDHINAALGKEPDA